jgi:uncharacterized protein YyaL (SSP411 family)
LGYALRGIVEGYLFFKEPTFLSAAQLTANALIRALRADGALPGRFDRRWRAATEAVCLTGSSQIANCWLQLYQITGNAAYRDAGCRVNAWVRRSIRLEGVADICGAVKGSLPADGDYCRFEYPNWATKFTIDANALELAVIGADGRL